MRSRWLDSAAEASGSAGTVDPSSERSLYLHPGQVFASSGAWAVTTILGSCVSVYLWDPHLRLGGVNHYLLPHWAGGEQASERFGNVSVLRLVEKVFALGSRRQDLQAKVFGGACVIDAFRERDNHLGVKNVEVARKLLAQEGIPVVGEDVGGNRGRKLVFLVSEGTVWVRQL